MLYPIKRLCLYSWVKRRCPWHQLVAVMIIKHQQRAVVLIQVPDSRRETYCTFLKNMNAACCVAGITVGMLRNVFISSKKIIYINTPHTCQLPQDK